jgi:phosphoenolpyruvate synthase/pyruvate phosphate dikinase
MTAQFFKRSLFTKAIVYLIIANFILGSCPVTTYARVDSLRPTAAKDNPGRKQEIREDLLRELLGDYKVLEKRDKLPFGGYIENVIDLQKSPQETKDNLKRIFELTANPGEEPEEYYLLYFYGAPIALVKKDREDKLDIRPIADDIENIPLSAIVEDVKAAQARGVNIVSIVLGDYQFFKERAKTDVPERMTLDWRELREYNEEFLRRQEIYRQKIDALKTRIETAKGKVARQLRGELEQLEKEYTGFLKTSGLALAGGKGLSLALMDGVVDVPAGFNVSTTAYFDFVRGNLELYRTIEEELKVLDTTDDLTRDAITRKIREVMQESTMPEDIKREVLIMYRHLNIIRALARKKTPTAVAVRSSGTKEDIAVATWLPITTGSMAGQSDTYLNVKGERDVLDKLIADWASLFTDRAVSYRDDAIFLIFSGIMGFEQKQPNQVYNDLVAKLREYAEKLKRPEFDAYADTLTNFRIPGSVNLMNAMEEILRHEENAEIRSCLDKMRQTAVEFVHPEEIGIDVVIMQMVESYLAGVIFTVNPATKMAGVPQALYKAWYQKNKSLVHLDDAGNIIGTRPIVVSFEISFGYGENVVGGKVDPDKFVLVTYDGEHWFVAEKNKGTKLIQMIDVEAAIALLKDKISESEIRRLASFVGEAVSYEEVGIRINGILTTRLYGTRYLKELPDKKEETDKDKRARLQEIAEEIAQMIKDQKSINDVKKLIKEKFYITSAAGAFGIQESVLDTLINEVFDSVKKAKTESEQGMSSLSKYFDSPEVAQAFTMMLREVWENKEFDLPRREQVLSRLKLDLRESRNLSYLIRSLINKSFTCNLETSDVHQITFSITDSEAEHIARLAWNIANYYKDQRDIEFAIEIDPSAPAEKRLYLYALDKQGKVMMMTDDGRLVTTEMKPDDLGGEGKVALRLYNVQARPYTADYTKVDFLQQRTEVDEDFIERMGYKPIAIGTKGQNATHAYVLAFDTGKSIAWHAQQILRLKSGTFTAEEKEQIEQLGFNPGPGLPIALYLLEADPSHDPIMRLVDAVITIRGGDTCHAAIFCREQGIPAITGVGKVILEGHLLHTGDGLTVDANNGRLYKLESDPLKRIPINFVKFRIKPYGIPGYRRDGACFDEDGFSNPLISFIMAATKTAEENAPVTVLAPDSGGIALARAEFKAEEMGTNVFAGYGYDLIQAIRAGKLERPKRIFVDDLINGRVPGTRKFIDRLNEQIYQYFRNNPKAQAQFKDVFGKEYTKKDVMALLVAFDILRDIQTGALDRAKLTPEQRRLLTFIEERISPEAQNALYYAYGVMQRRFNFDFNIIQDLENHPWILEELEAKLKEKGYTTFKEYAGKEFTYFYNLLGFSIAPDQKNKSRAYDFAQDKVRGLIGSEIFSWPGENPLVGLRGTSLEVEGVDEEFAGNQKVLSFLLEAIIDADANTHNQSWFYVFVRFAREMDLLDMVLEKIVKERGKLPKQIGIMIEVPSDAMLARTLAQKLVTMQQKYAKYGVKSIFFSFGTNDYSHLAGKGDREDPRMKLVILDPAAIEAIAEMKQEGYFYIDATKQLPLIDEGAPIMMQLMEAVVRAANELGVETSLCGEAITALVGRGDYVSAGRIMSLLKSFGVSLMSVRLLASMIRYDAMAATKEIVVPEQDREVLFDLKANGEVTQQAGVIKGGIIYVDNADDLIPDLLKGLKGEELEARREFLKMQSPESAQSTMRTYDKIVVITRNLVAMNRDEFLKTMSPQQFNRLIGVEGLIKPIGDWLYVWTNLDSTADKFKAELELKGYDKEAQKGILEAWQKAFDNATAGLEKRGIDWDDLQYAKAIIVDSSVNLEGWDVFMRAKGIVPTRVKVKVKGIGELRQELEGQFVTIDYALGKIYKGNLKVQKKAFTPSALPIPEVEPQVEIKQAVREDANDAYANLKYHPLILLAYERGELGELEKIFNEYVGKLIEEISKVTQEQHPEKKQWLLKGLQEKIAQEPEPIIRQALQYIYERLARGEEISLSEKWVQDLRTKYFDDLKKGIVKLMGEQSVQEFIKGVFKQNMQQAIEENRGNFVVHTTTSLNSLVFRNMLGGFLVEQVNPNPDYGLLGAARAIGDFHEINRLELAAFKEVRAAMPVEERKNLGLQITELKGTQSGAVVIAWKHILKAMGIIPGEDGLEIGVNIATPADTLAIGEYFTYFKDFGTGLSFVTYDTLMLGAAWAGVDIYWDEWRRLAKEEELQELGGTAVKIVKGKMAEANAAGEGATKRVVDFTGEETSRLARREKVPIVPVAGEPAIERIQSADTTVYEALSGDGRFEAVVKSLRGFKDYSGVLVIDADVILENAGTIATLRKIKEANVGLQVKVWTDNEDVVNKLKAVGVKEVADIVISEGMVYLLDDLLRSGITKEQIAVILTPIPLEPGTNHIAAEQLITNRFPGIKIIRLEGAFGTKINAMPLVIARAIAGIFQGVDSVAKPYQELVKSYKENGQISEADSEALNDIASQISDIPLLKNVSKKITDAQAAYQLIKEATASGI